MPWLLLRHTVQTPDVDHAAQLDLLQSLPEQEPSPAGNRRPPARYTLDERAPARILRGRHPSGSDPILLERLIQNLVDNAIRYNLPDNGHLTITTGEQDGTAELVVENSGPAIPAYAVAGLFEPFRRLPSTDRLADPSGAGLGLSIVESVAHAHGGDVHASAREEGGLTVRVRLPQRVSVNP